MDWTIIGDPHVTHKSLEKADTLFDIIEELGNSTIILGDILDTKEVIRGKCMNLIYNRLRDSELEFYILVGNHDFFNLECEDHSLQVLKSLPNVTVVDEPYKIQLGSDKNALLLPYYEDLEAFKKALKSKADVLFMHQGVTGFDYGNGHVADGSGHGEVDQKAVKGFSRVISGHFHKYEEKGNLTFLGTPFSHNFGETDQTKYIGVYYPDEDDLELLETPFPRHRTIKFELDEKSSIDLVEKALKEFQEENPKDILRVVLSGSEQKIKVFDKGKFPEVKFIERADSEEESENLLDETDSNAKKFIVWAEEIKGLEEEITKLGLDILREAK